MHLSRWFGVVALLTATACNPRGGGGGGGGGGDDASTDSATPQDVSSPGDASPPDDLPATPDVPGTDDVPAKPDVPPGPDVPEGPRCGDGACNGAETCESCRADCLSTCPPPPPDVPMARCGDGTCNGAETCESCRADCLSTCPPPPPDVPVGPRCGDGTCTASAGETCTSCPSDCGPCPTGAVTDPCPAGATQGPNRNCGWRPGTTFPCSPGRATMVGCSGEGGTGSLCQPSYGACMGDPTIRVCPGTTPCPFAVALVALSGNLDDQCGACPSAYITCPSSGQIHVLTGDYDSNVAQQRGTCTPAVR